MTLPYVLELATKGVGRACARTRRWRGGVNVLAGPDIVHPAVAASVGEPVDAARLRARLIMAPAEPPARGIHLVGGHVPLASAEVVFQTVAAEVGDRLRRIPDGETGPRSDWIVWQLPDLHLPAPVRRRPRRGRTAGGPCRACSRRGRPGRRPCAFGALGYADAAIASYRAFARLKRRRPGPGGLALPGLPAHAAGADQRLRGAPSTRRRWSRCTEARLLGPAGATLLAEVPHDQLAIQWDTNFEFGMLEGVFPVWFGDVKGGILERLLRLARHVPGAEHPGEPHVPIVTQRIPSRSRASAAPAGSRSSSRASVKAFSTSSAFDSARRVALYAQVVLQPDPHVARPWISEAAASWNSAG